MKPSGGQICAKLEPHYFPSVYAGGLGMKKVIILLVFTHNVKYRRVILDF